jgi:hypothetical protein
MGKFVRWDVIDGRLSWSFDQDKIAAEKLFDGCYIVSGEVPKEKMAASEVVASYKKLGLVEEAFRSLKTVQLEVRPVYHKTDDRIRSHVFLCTLAYYLQWHLKQRLEPLFAGDGTHKDRQWTVRNVIERLAAIRRDKIAMGAMGQKGTKLTDLCSELAITRQTLYRHVAPDGTLRLGLPRFSVHLLLRPQIWRYGRAASRSPCLCQQRAHHTLGRWHQRWRVLRRGWPTKRNNETGPLASCYFVLIVVSLRCHGRSFAS